MKPNITYSTYLRLDSLLQLQVPRSDEPEHDETLFIIIHQVYELWFKQMLHELDHLSKLLNENDTPRALNTLKRVLTILKTVVTQIDVLETMSPLEFNAFRRYLSSASGFQSYQFREIEFLLGYKRKAMVTHFADDPIATARLEHRYDAPTLWDAFVHYLAARGYTVPNDILQRDVREQVDESIALQQVLIEVYRKDTTVLPLCERLVDLDEGLQEWRYRHVKMVERTIGTKPGTGGSAGTAYLRTTLNPFFPDLWAIRTEL